jgi:hypothetical protein
MGRRIIDSSWTQGGVHMDAISMVKVATWLFILAALGGIVMAGIRFGSGRNPPVVIPYAHGLLAGAGLTLLIYAAWVGGLGGMVMLAIILLLVAAAGGSILNLVYHWKQVPIPKGLTAAHILLAVAGVGLLLPVAF